MSPSAGFGLRLAAAVAAFVFLALLGAARSQTVGTTGIPAIPPQQARIWVYRDIQSSALPTVPLVRFNGVIAGAAYQGGAFYRDVPPGHYHVTVDSIGVDVNQSSDVNLAPGQEAYIQILQLDDWDETPYEPTYATFYAWLRPWEMARPAVWRSYNYGGGPLTGAVP
jgi:hypothetical protein